MSNSHVRIAAFVVVTIATGVAVADLEYSWTYYRPGNTGVMGDYSSGLWVDPDGTLYLGAYVPQFEEGGFSRFIEDENRWENFSNVDYPVMGTPSATGSARISDFEPDGSGALWMGTWRGALYFDPAVGPDSFVRYDADNSPLPGGSVTDVETAPDGSMWFACYSLSWGGGGLARYRPDTDEWTFWGYDPEPDGWPGRVLLEAAAVQPKPGGGYLVWIEDTFGDVVFDSDTEEFSDIPNNEDPGDIKVVLPNGTDDSGNTWMLRFVAPGQLYRLDYRQPDGTWVSPPMPFAGAISLPAFHAFGDTEALMIGGGSEAFYFNGTSWSSLGVWRPGGFTYGIDMDDEGNVWVSGNGGAARRDAQTGQWQRYRLTNTGMMDNFLRDIAFAPGGDVWVTHNGGPGIGGIGVFDGLRWHNHNILTYGLGEDWPFPTDNADAITYRSSTGHVAFNPTNNGIREWDGQNYITLEALGTSDGLVEDSDGRLWTMGNYFSLRYYDETGFHDVPIAGWGANVVRDPDRPGTVWACANLEVVRTDGDYLFSRQNVDFPELNPMHDVLTTVAAGSNGIAWVGSTEGIFRVDANTGTHEWFHSSNSELPGDQMTPLAVSPDGKIWFTNFNSQGIEASLVWFDGTDHGEITRADGLPHAQIYDAELREVPGGYELWLACASRGIAVLTVESGVDGDIDGDGLVNVADLLILLADWGVCPDCPADLDGDGNVAVSDLLILLANWS
jgi:sugar lactone lactonase YvrE